MKMVVDTNIIIRLLTGDDVEQSPIAKELILKIEENHTQLVVYPLVVTECVYVLANQFGYKKRQITESLLNLFDVDCIQVDNSEIVKKALKMYVEHNVDIADALIASQASIEKLPVITWNRKHFRRLECEYYTPEEIVSG